MISLDYRGLSIEYDWIFYGSLLDQSINQANVEPIELMDTH